MSIARHQIMATKDGLLQSYVNSRVLRNNNAAREDPRPTVSKPLL